MKEYNENIWAKMLFVGMSIPMCALALWVIFGRESLFITFSGVAILALYLSTLINSLVHKIILGEDFIAEKSLFKSRRILLQEITQINIQFNFVEIISGKEKIGIGTFIIENSNEIIGSVISKIKENERILFGGDPILIQSYFNEFSDHKSLPEYNGGEPANFTFIENAELVEKRWLFRRVNLATSKGNLQITYFGKGMGYECVFVNDELVSKQDSSLWYVPNFDFNHQGINFSVNVRVYPWMTIRKFWIEVDNKTVYSE